MKFAIVLLVASVACINAQAFGPFAGANPFAAAFNPYLNGVFGGAAPGAGAVVGGAPAGPAAVVPPAAAPFGGFSVSSFFQSIVLQKEADRLLNQPNFPADLSERVLDVLANAELAFANCNTATLPWLQIRCVKPALTTAKNDLKLIDDEWQARLAATTAAAVAAGPVQI
ncbi:uncharacterized protein LOC6573560 [Drosophila mojavensis]|uniref:CG14292-PA n=1 Tax=Drosophila mojavensis TaxID=7230 RepID=B4K589_DROMO|nr:uncharacterized protein LOC6573560 [Drosophila mojavensis]EDW15089.1 uncharacterized protein Dmoj_GI24624 [Drosophila mojavensis]